MVKPWFSWVKRGKFHVCFSAVSVRKPWFSLSFLPFFSTETLSLQDFLDPQRQELKEKHRREAMLSVCVKERYRFNSCLKPRDKRNSFNSLVLRTSGDFLKFCPYSKTFEGSLLLLALLNDYSSLWPCYLGPFVRYVFMFSRLLQQILVSNMTEVVL